MAEPQNPTPTAPSRERARLDGNQEERRKPSRDSTLPAQVPGETPGLPKKTSEERNYGRQRAHDRSSPLNREPSSLPPCGQHMLRGHSKRDPRMAQAGPGPPRTPSRGQTPSEASHSDGEMLHERLRELRQGQLTSTLGSRGKERAEEALGS